MGASETVLSGGITKVGAYRREFCDGSVEFRGRRVEVENLRTGVQRWECRRELYDGRVEF